MKQYYVMKYSDRESTYNNPSDVGKYVAIDWSSGGYPYAVDCFHNAQIWYDCEQFKRYQQMFPFVDVYALDIQLTKMEAQ